MPLVIAKLLMCKFTNTDEDYDYPEKICISDYMTKSTFKSATDTMDYHVKH